MVSIEFLRYMSTKVEIKLKKKEAFNWNELLMGACIGDDPSKRATPPARDRRRREFF